MRSIILVALITLAFLAAVSAKRNSSGSRGSGEKHVKDKHFLDHWRKHRKGKGRLYNKREVEEREATFIKTKKFHEEWNAKKDRTYEVGSNKFDDFTDDEKREYVGEVEPPIHESRALPAPITSGWTPATPPPPAVNWRTFSSPVTNQGGCGGCWAYAGVAVLESFFRQTAGRSLQLSQQYYIDCDRTQNLGCNGGLAYWLFQTVQREGNTMPTLASYPATSYATNKPGTCRASGTYTRVATPFLRPNFITPNGNSTLTKQLLHAYGAIGISMQVIIQNCPNFYGYKSGVYTDTCGCSTDCTGTNHAVVLEGYGRDAATGKQFWIIKNSWGTGWGEGGYMRMEITPNNKCAIACRNVYVEKA